MDSNKTQHMAHLLKLVYKMCKYEMILPLLEMLYYELIF